jgi:hypothetical protein
MRKHLLLIELLYFCFNLLHIQALTSDFNVINQVLSTVLPTCTKIVVNDQSSSLHRNSDFFNALSVNNWEILTYQLNYTRTKNETIHVGKLLDLPQHRAQCVVALVSLLSASENSNQFWLEALSRIVNKEKNFYIFHTRHETLNKVLLNEGIYDRIKFKLGVSLSIFTNVVLTRSVCFYCNNGKPTVVDIQIKQALLAPLAEDERNKLNLVFPNYAKNFYGHELRITCNVQVNWLLEIRREDKGWVPKRGIYIFALKEIMTRLNLTGKFFPSFPNGESGLRLPNGTWLGGVGDVLAGRADIAPAIAQVYPRNLFVDHTSALNYEWLTFTTGNQERADRFVSWTAIYRPLKRETWIFIAFCSTTMAVALKMLNKLYSTFETYYQNSIFVGSLIFKSMMEQQISILNNKTLPAYFRVIFAFWLLFGIIISTAYKSKLFVFLLFVNVELPPNTFQSLSESEYGTMHYYTDSSYALMNTSMNPTFIKIFKSMVNEPSDVECLKAVLVEKRACISWVNLVDYVIHKNLSTKRGQKAELVKAPDSMWFLQTGIIMPKQMIYNQEFSNYIRKAVDTGIALKWKMDDNAFVDEERSIWERENNSSNKFYTISEHGDELTLTHLSVVIYIIFFGSAIAFALFLFEHWSKRYCENLCTNKLQPYLLLR